MVERTTETRRLLVALSATWATAWVAGMILFAFVVLRLDTEIQQGEVESELALRAAAVYGLVWFDAEGTFNADALRVEEWLEEGGIDIWVIESGTTPTIHHSPVGAEATQLGLIDITERVVAEQATINKTVGAKQIHAIPTYLEGADAEAHAAIIAVGDTSPTAPSPFARRVFLIAAILGFLGIAIGVFLARWSVRPVVAALSQRERFLVASAHELRSPVASMLAVCESGTAGDEPPSDALARAEALAHRTAQVVDDLLLFARLDSGSAELERESVRLDLLVETELPEGATLRVVEDHECIAQVDPRLVRVAVRNLVDNARLHGTGKQGPEVLVARDSISVRDAGPGFPAAILDLSRRDFDLAPSSSGAGVGLAITKMIAELHGGVLSLENDPAGGALATLNLGARSRS